MNCTIESDSDLAHTIASITAQFRASGNVEVSWKVKGRRTLSQNAALHVWCQLLADTLNDGGFDMMAVLRHDAEIPWTGTAVKEYLWRPIQKALTDKTSTTEISTVDPTQIHETLCRHLGAKLGVECPAWPTRAA